MDNLPDGLSGSDPHFNDPNKRECPNCGTELEWEWSYCPHCGERATY